MASVTLQVAGTFPAGASVSAYLKAWQTSPDSAPSGTALATSVVSATGALAFTGLAVLPHVATAQVSGVWRSVSFTPDVPSPTGGGTAEPIGPAAGDLAGTYPNPTLRPDVGLTGNPTAATQTPGDNSTRIATTAFAAAADALKVSAASPALTGTPTAPTAAPGTNTTQLATTAFAAAADALKANLASPTFTGTPAAPTPTAGDSTTKVATTAFVGTAVAPAVESADITIVDVVTQAEYDALTPVATTLYIISDAASAVVGTVDLNTVEGYGAVGDGKVLFDGSITSGSAILTSPSAAFVSGDVGKIVAILGAGTGSPVAGKGFTIASWQSATQVTLSATAGSTVTAGPFAYGTDDAAAIQAAVTAIGTVQGGGDMRFGAKMYMIGTKVITPGGVRLQGEGIDYNGDDPFPGRGTVLCGAGPVTGAVLRLGDLQYTGAITGAPFDSGHTMPMMYDMAIFGSDIVTDALTINSARWKVSHCQMGGGITTQISIPGQNGEMDGCIVNGHSRGTGIDNIGPDNSFTGNQIRGWRVVGFDAKGSNFQFSGNKVYPNNTEDAVALASFRLQAPGGMVVDNIFGETNMAAPQVLVVCTAAGFVRDVGFIANNFYKTSPTNLSQSCVKIDTTLGEGRCLQFVGNRAHCNLTNNVGYKAFVEVIGTNALPGWTMVGNVAGDTTTLWTAASSQVPSLSRGNTWRATRSAVTTTYTDDTKGRATLNGTGAATTFTIAHGMDAAPSMVIVTPGSSAASTAYYVTVDATNITVTYTVAPASGTGNVVLNWHAAA